MFYDAVIDNFDLYLLTGGSSVGRASDCRGYQVVGGSIPPLRTYFNSQIVQNCFFYIHVKYIIYKK